MIQLSSILAVSLTASLLIVLPPASSFTPSCRNQQWTLAKESSLQRRRNENCRPLAVSVEIPESLSREDDDEGALLAAAAEFDSVNPDDKVEAENATKSDEQVVAHSEKSKEAIKSQSQLFVDGNMIPAAEIESVIDKEQLEKDEKYMKMALEEAMNGDASPFPQPLVGAVLVSEEGQVLGRGRSDYSQHAVRACLENFGLKATPLSQWCISWPHDDECVLPSLSGSTLYVTLEPSNERHGTALPPLTQLIEMAGVSRVVIGCADPVQSRAHKGAAALHAAGMDVSLGIAVQDKCMDLIDDYAALANTKLHRMARNHFRQFSRPLGFLHCSVVASDNVKAFARHGNAFGTEQAGKKLNYRDFGSFEIAPPPEVIWADTSEEDEEQFFAVDFDEENPDEDLMELGSPMMPWYEQVDAVVATFPKEGNGPLEDNSVKGRLNGLKWLASHGKELPSGVERILVMDATDLPDLPLSNDDPNLPKGVDVEAFWKAEGRRATRVLLRKGSNERARAAATAAANAAKAAADAALRAAAAIESGDAQEAAEAAKDFANLAKSDTQFIQAELGKTQKLKNQLEDLGVVVETIDGGQPADVMKHLGDRNGLETVVWRAGCWGDRGVQAILAGAFQWISAHLTVDANGGRFWQLMLAENALQAACGPSRKVKILAEQEDISLEYCDEPGADLDCVMSVEGKPIRHVRLDARLVLVDDNRPRELKKHATQAFDQRFIEEQAPWFL